MRSLCVTCGTGSLWTSLAARNMIVQNDSALGDLLHPGELLVTLIRNRDTQPAILYLTNLFLRPYGHGPIPCILWTLLCSRQPFVCISFSLDHRLHNYNLITSELFYSGYIMSYHYSIPTTFSSDMMMQIFFFHL